jgi:hypothetical protein
VAAMIRSGCEKVCPLRRPSSTSRRQRNITSSGHFQKLALQP